MTEAQDVAAALELLAQAKELVADPINIEQCSECLAQLAKHSRESAAVRSALLSEACDEWISSAMLSCSSAQLQSQARVPPCAHSAHVGVQGCALLGHLAIDPPNAQQIVAAGAISAICNGMKNFPAQEEVQAMG